MQAPKSHTPMKPLERHVVLVAPEVHWNTGNIGRTCIGTGACLHLIKPLGFSIDSKQVKRAGLDYWHHVKLHVWESLPAFFSKLHPEAREVALLTKNAARSFRQIPCHSRLFLFFGSETRGLPDTLLKRFPDARYHIPTTGGIRCLNLSTAVGIALYESLRGCDPPHAWHEASK